MKDDLIRAAGLLRAAEGETPGNKALQDFHALAWDLLCRNARKLGLTRGDLIEIGNNGTSGADVVAQGGGTGKTPPSDSS